MNAATATASGNAPDALFGESHERYRERIHAVTSRWSPSDVDTWERAGLLPRTIFHDLGDAGAFRERWEQGRLTGIPYAVQLAQEVARVCGGAAVAVMLHSETFLSPLIRAGAEGWQGEVVEQALGGRAIGCFTLTEPRGGSDIVGIQTRAERTGDGWRLRGEKRFASNVGTGTHAIVVARTGDRGDARDLSLFLVDLSWPGIELRGFYPTLGARSCGTAHLVLDAELPAEAIVGPAGSGLLYAHQGLGLERIAIAAQLVAAAETCLRLAVAYGRRRETFGTPLVKHGALRHRLADAQTQLWAAEAFLERVARRAMNGENVSHEGAALKLFAAHAAGHVIDECLQVVGGRGYTANYPFERFWRDARVARIGAGTDEMMRELVASSLDRPDADYERMVDELAEGDVPGPAGGSLADLDGAAGE